MYYYLVTFLISLFFVLLAERSRKFNRNKIFVLFSAIAIIIPCWLAGIRGESVGTDVMVYAVPQYNYAQSFSNFFTYTLFSSVEPLYSLLVYICSKLNLGVTTLLFLSQLFVILPIYVVGVKKQKKLSLTFFMFIYYFLFYHLTLNMMRQTIACSLLLLAYTHFEEKQKIKYITLSIIACLFHSSALVAVILFAAVDYANSGKGSFLKKTGIVLATAFLAFNFQSIINIVINQLGLLPQDYYQRIIRGMQDNTISIFETLFRGVFVAFPLLTIVAGKIKDTELRKYNFVSIMGYVFSFLALIAQYLVRFSYYFQFMFLLTLPMAVRKFTSKGYQRLGVYLVLVIVVIIYWYIIYIGWGWYGTMPYVIGNRN